MAGRPAWWIVSGLTLSLLSCDSGGYHEHLAGESAHFRLWVDDGLSTPVDANETLKGLEDNWSSVGALLSVPDGTIDYHIATHDDIAGQCQIVEFVRACAIGTAIYSPGTFDQHELNHAYMALRSSHRPALFLLEGLAEGVGCYTGGEEPPRFADPDQWTTVLGSTYSGPADVYASGRRLVRYLILSFGIGETLAYYEQAPPGSDPQAFADNFGQFWPISLDQAWTAMQESTPGGTDTVLPVCPCSGIPVLQTDPSAQPTVATSGDLYWTLPDGSDGGTVALATPQYWAVSLSDCNRQQIEVSQTNLLFARLGSGFYVSADQLSVSSGQFVSDTCAGAPQYDVSSVSGFGVALATPAGQPSTVYLLLTSSTPRSLQSSTTSIGACSTCDFTSSTCQSQPPGSAVSISGPTYVSLSLSTVGQVAFANLSLTP